MRTRNIMIALGVAAALAVGAGAYSHTAFAQDGGYGPGWMMGGGYGPGNMMGGNGPGYGPDGGYGPGYGHMRGYGPGMMQGNGNGYGPRYGHMRGWGGGPGAGPVNCPAFAQGYGPGNGPRGAVQGNEKADQTLNLSTDDVKARVERWLTWRGNPRLKVGEVKEKDADTITADVVTKDNSLVQRFIVDRHTGFMRQDNS